MAAMRRILPRFLATAAAPIAALSLATALAASCGGESGDGPASSAAASASAGAGGATGATGTTSTGGGEGGSGGDPVPQPPGEPEPLPVAEWMVAKVFDASKDQILPAIEDGSFDLPASGKAFGADWTPVVPGEGGALVTANVDLVYAVARVEVPEGRRLFARGDTVAGFYVDNAVRQPGDFYHSRAMRVPLATGSGSKLVVARALGRRNVPEVELFATDAEIVLNTADVTAPDLVIGSTDEQPIGVAVLNLRDDAVADVSARVVEDERFDATALEVPSLSPGATTQLAFLLRPKAPLEAEHDAMLPVRLRIDSPSLAWPYEAEVHVRAVAGGSRHRRTRISGVDGSVQYYAAMPPAGFDPAQTYGLILSLHGAGVEAGGQAGAYSPKDWAFLVAPTNRRPFGFDWEEWGRLDAIEALEHAAATFPIDPERIHLTGHSMGGHGSWHVGVHFPDRFGVVAPSAGWISFDKYGGPPFPEGPIGRARAASRTLDYVENFARSSVFIIHGEKDTNVPVSHAKTMHETLVPIAAELAMHLQPGADHWWDLGPEEGADCVDWEPMIALMKERKRDPLPLEFAFTTPSPWISPRHSYVTIRSAVSPMEDCTIVSTLAGDVVELATTNVRSLVVDGAALAAKGIAGVSVDGAPYPIEPGGAGPILVGPGDGKTPEANGPLNQVFHRPFCFVWDDAGPAAYRDYAAFLLSWWSVIGNGHGCGVPRSAVGEQLAAEKNLVWLGVPKEKVPGGEALPIAWSASGVTIGSKTMAGAAVAFVYATQGRLSAYVAAPEGSEHLLFRYVPFGSRSGMPDFFAWNDAGVQASGFFDAEWKLDPAYATGL